MTEIFQQILNPQFVVLVLIAGSTFATVMAVALPFMGNNKLDNRMRSVAAEREKMREQKLQEIRDKEQAGQLRQKPKTFVAGIVNLLNLRKALETDGLALKLKMAGMRGQGPLLTFLLARTILPIVVMAGSAFYLFMINSHGYNQSMCIAFVVIAGMVGFYLPNILLTNKIQKRQQSISIAFPDALDLLLICVQSGMSIEASFNKVATEISGQSAELAEELTLTTAEISYLQSRRQAYENLGLRTGLAGIKAVATSLIQAERYGTPLSQALKAMAQDYRDMRMAQAEMKAASLPPKLTVPMIVFFLPVLFAVILGPAYIKATM